MDKLTIWRASQDQLKQDQLKQDQLKEHQFKKVKIKKQLRSKNFHRKRKQKLVVTSSKFNLESSRFVFNTCAVICMSAICRVNNSLFNKQVIGMLK